MPDHDKADVRPLTSNTVTVIDTLDESRNRLQHGLHTETVDETVEVNMVTETMDQEIDSGEESKNRFKVTTIEVDVYQHEGSGSRPTNSNRRRLQRRVAGSIEVTMILTSRPKRAEADVTEMATIK